MSPPKELWSVPLSGFRLIAIPRCLSSFPTAPQVRTPRAPQASCDPHGPHCPHTRHFRPHPPLPGISHFQPERARLGSLRTRNAGGGGGFRFVRFPALLRPVLLSRKVFENRGGNHAWLRRVWEGAGSARGLSVQPRPGRRGSSPRRCGTVAAEKKLLG